MKSLLPKLVADVRASVVVFLVALPLAMGIAVASGYPPIAGLITGIIGGIVVGALSGAPMQVSGAAAGLTVIVYQGVQSFGMAGMTVILLLAGLMQLIGGLAGIGRWFQAVSPTVLHAMLAGIGVLIIGSQTHVMLDGATLGNGLDNLSGIPAALGHVFLGENPAGLAAFGLGILTIATMILWPLAVEKMPAALTKKLALPLIPAPLIAIVFASIAAWLFSFSGKFVNIPADLFADFKFAQIDIPSIWQNPALIAAALQLALIASAESLLCAAAVDQMHNGPRANFDRELKAQGIGNALCGLLGAIPMTGVIVRSSANVRAGAQTRASAMLHGVWLLLFVALVPQVLALVPMASLAGLLVYTGAKLVNIKTIKAIYQHGKSELAIYALTVGAIVGVDLLWGVMLGLALSGVKLLHTLSHLSITVADEKNGAKQVVELRGAATFLKLPRLSGALESLPHGGQVVLRSQELHAIDQACLEHLESWKRRFESHGGQIETDRPLFAKSS